MSWLGLEDARVLVAGAGGLGTACVRGLLEAGASVILVDRDEARLKNAAEDNLTAGRSLGTVVADLNAPGAALDVMEAASAGSERLDGLIHCVGINDRTAVLETSDATWEEILDTNLSSAFRLSREAGRLMCEQRGGRIVLFSSVSGLLAHEGHGAYAASKGAINQAMRVMAVEWAPFGVAVNALAPGYLETPLTKHYLDKPGARDGLLAKIPYRRFSTPDEVANAAVFLVSNRSSYITGHVLYVDGGRTLV